MKVNLADIISDSVKETNLPITDPFHLSRLLEDAFLRGYTAAIHNFSVRKGDKNFINDESIDSVLEDLKKLSIF